MTTGGVLIAGVLMLFLAGLYGLLVLRNLFKIVIALQLLVKGVVLALVAAGASNGRIDLGQSLAATVIVADTVVAVIGLALAIQIQRRFDTLDAAQLSKLRR